MDINRIKLLAGVNSPVAIKPVATLVKEFHNIRMSEELDFKRTAKEFGAVSVVLKEQNGFTVAVVTFDEATLTESEEKYKAFLAETKMTAAQKKERSEKIDDKDSENEKEADECKVASEETKEVSEKSAESEEVKESANTIEIVEVSKKMLGSYIKKSTDPNDDRSVLNLASKGAYKLAKAENSEDDGYKEDSKAVKRAASIAKAVNKITKQEEKSVESEEVKESTTDDSIVEETTDAQLDIFEKAQKISKDEGVVQHVNKNDADDGFHLSDWYDSDKTVASFENGKRLDEANTDVKSDVPAVSESGNNNFMQTVDDSANELNARMGVDVERKATVKVPAAVKASVAARIKELKQSIEQYDEKGYNDQSQKLNAIDSLEHIMDNLSSNDAEGLKKAQIYHGTLMSPITDLFPSNLILFLADARLDWLDRLK